MTPEARAKLIANASPKRRKELKYTAYYWLRDDQIIPPGNWRYCFARCARGWGKTHVLAAYVQLLAEHVYKGSRGFIAIVAPTHTDINKTINDELTKIYPPNEGPEYIENKNELRFQNGTVVYTYSSDQPLRGGNFKVVFCDEMVAWCDAIGTKIKEKFDVLDFACREGAAQFIITTTPKPFPIFREWQKQALAGDPEVVMMTGGMDANTALSEDAKRSLRRKFEGTRFGRQELEGEIVDDNPYALWTFEDFDLCRVSSPPELKRIVVAIDPAVTSKEKSDHTGIMVGGLGFDNHAYILKDATCKMSPDGWAKKAVELYRLYGADCIVAEANNGGDMISALIKTIDPNILVKCVRATKNKITRAEPVANLYKLINNGVQSPKVHHVGPAKDFHELEEECLSYIANSKGDSPDSMDSLVWCVTELFWGSRSAPILNLTHCPVF